MSGYVDNAVASQIETSDRFVDDNTAPAESAWRKHDSRIIPHSQIAAKGYHSTNPIPLYTLSVACPFTVIVSASLLIVLVSLYYQCQCFFSVSVAVVSIYITHYC